MVYWLWPLFLFIGSTASHTTDIVVQTPLGSLVGVNEGSYHVFRGIRYVEAPRRFEVASPRKAWNGTLSAQKFGDACYLGGRIKGVQGLSEDCLFANVWAPSHPTSNMPVVVFIHGGGFLIGSGADPRYWGDSFVTDPSTPVVYVTLNYRMGILGFYSGDAGANVGFQDQQMALRWVRDNIEAFGGNPKEVTLSGQSAGAMSVQVHLVAPGSRGLFHRAFMASTVGLHYRNLTENKAFVDSAAHSVGCFGLFQDQVSCMRKRKASVLDAAAVASGYLFHLQSACDECDNLLPWTPVVDGVVIPHPPLDMIREGKHARVPVVVSTVRNESLAFVPGILRGIADIKLGYDLAMGVLFRDNAATVKAHYAAAPDSAGMNLTTRLALAITDTLFTCYGRYIARLLATDSPTYLSTFMHAPSADADPMNGGLDPSCEKGATCHASDLSWIFPSSAEMRNLTKLAYTPQEAALAVKYSAAVRVFAYGIDKVTERYWLRYSAKADESLLWSESGSGPLNISSTTSRYHNDHCNMLESLGFPLGPWRVQETTTIML